MMATATTADEVKPEDLQAEISRDLRDLTAEAALVKRLASTRQRGLGFLTAEAKAALEQLARAEAKASEARRRPAGEKLGQAWLRPLELTGPGITAAPGNVSAISVHAQVVRELHRLVEVLIRTLYDDGICTLHHLGDRPGVYELTDHIRALAMDVETMPTLRQVHGALEPLLEALRGVIDGNDRSHLKDGCPHCGRDTLVVTWREYVVRCEKSPDSVHFAPCTCSDPLCDCKVRPVAYRHTWYLDRPAKAPDSWRALAGRLNLNRSISKEPPR